MTDPAFWPSIAVELDPNIPYLNAGYYFSGGGYIDISNYVLSASITRGRENELAQFQAGTMSLELDNTDNRFGITSYYTGSATSGSATTMVDSTKTWVTNQWAGWNVIITSGTGSQEKAAIISNTGTTLTVASWSIANPDATSKYAIITPYIFTAAFSGTTVADVVRSDSMLRPGTGIRITATYNAITYPIFAGHIDTIEEHFDNQWSTTVTMTCVDAFWAMGRAPITVNRSAEDSITRLTRVVAETYQGGGSGYQGTGGAGLSTMVATQYDNQSCLSAAQDCELTENGELWCRSDGLVQMQNRLWRGVSKTTASCTFGDQAGDISIEDLKSRFNIENLVSGVTVTNVAATPVSATAAGATSFFGYQTVDRTIQVDDPIEPADHAGFLIQRYGIAKPRLKTIQVMPAVDPANAWPACLGLEIGDRVRIRRTLNALGYTFDGQFHIDQIQHQISIGDGPHTWDIIFGVTDASLYQNFWILEDATFGVLNSTTIATY